LELRLFVYRLAQHLISSRRSLPIVNVNFWLTSGTQCVADFGGTSEAHFLRRIARAFGTDIQRLETKGSCRVGCAVRAKLGGRAVAC
jgi:hypothetical protein